ncbi:MAG: hypothetical protein ACK5LL_12575 [Suipraeoptans sp.]
MKKIRMGVVEIMGYIGMFLWLATLFLRNINLSANTGYQFVLGVLPNIGAAWVMTMFGKWIIIFGFKQSFTVKKHIILCVGIVLMALVSEFIHDLFLNSPFDPYDMVVTIVAQCLMVFLPVCTKDIYRQ